MSVGWVDGVWCLTDMKIRTTGLATLHEWSTVASRVAGLPAVSGPPAMVVSGPPDWLGRAMAGASVEPVRPPAKLPYLIPPTSTDMVDATPASVPSELASLIELHSTGDECQAGVAALAQMGIKTRERRPQVSVEFSSS